MLFAFLPGLVYNWLSTVFPMHWSFTAWRESSAFVTIGKLPRVSRTKFATSLTSKSFNNSEYTAGKELRKIAWEQTQKKLSILQIFKQEKEFNLYLNLILKIIIFLFSKENRYLKFALNSFNLFQGKKNINKIIMN